MPAKGSSPYGIAPTTMPTGLGTRTSQMKYAWQLWKFGNAPKWIPIRSFSKLSELSNLTRTAIEVSYHRDDWEGHALQELSNERECALNAVPKFTEERKILSDKLQKHLQLLQDTPERTEEEQKSFDMIERLAKITGLDQRIAIESKIEEKYREVLIKAQAKIAERQAAEMEKENTRKVEGMTFDVEAG